MENNEIMERLLQDDKEVKAPAKDAAIKDKPNQAGNSQLSWIRVVTAKYKLYIILLLILICLFWLNYNPSMQNTLIINKSAYTQAKNRLKSIETDIQNANNDMQYLCNPENGIMPNEQTLKDCLNEWEDCENLPEQWKEASEDEEDLRYDISIPFSYLQLHSLYNKKMAVDEKLVLKNLNEYLIKQDILGWSKSKVWDILRISIGDPKPIYGWNHFFQVPVNVQIEFSTIDDLIWFLHNVERRLIDDSEDRILYKIQSVSYDIIANDEPQITNISMIAYYYYDEMFEGKTECSWNYNVQSSVDSNDEASKPPFYKIFSIFGK